MESSHRYTIAIPALVHTGNSSYHTWTMVVSFAQTNTTFSSEYVKSSNQTIQQMMKHMLKLYFPLHRCSPPLLVLASYWFFHVCSCVHLRLGVDVCILKAKSQMHTHTSAVRWVWASSTLKHVWWENASWHVLALWLIQQQLY